MAPNPMLEEACSLKLFCVLILLAIWGSNVPAMAASASAARNAVPGMICKGTPDPALCARILSGTPANAPLNSQIAIITTYALRVSKAAYGAIGKDAESMRKWKKYRVRSETDSSSDGRLAEGAILDCLDLMGNSMDQMRATIGKVSKIGMTAAHTAARAQLMDARVSLSASLTFQSTCQDELSQHPGAAPGAKLVLRDGQLITGSLGIALSLADTLQGKLRP